MRPICLLGPVIQAVDNGNPSYLSTANMQPRWASFPNDGLDLYGVADDIIALVDGNKNAFYFNTLSLLASRGTSVNRQLFYLSLVMQHKGLSRSGLQLMSMMNLALSPRSFDTELDVHYQQLITQRRYIANMSGDLDQHTSCIFAGRSNRMTQRSLCIGLTTFPSAMP